jgi:hypothetical protein
MQGQSFVSTANLNPKRSSFMSFSIGGLSYPADRQKYYENVSLDKTFTLGRKTKMQRLLSD